MTWLYGVASPVPLSFCRGVHDFSLYGKHWIFADLDVKKPSLFFEVNRFFVKHFGRCVDWFEVTEHGLHVVMFEPLSFEELVHFMPHIPYIDMKWYSFGVHRGQWFLVTYKPFFDSRLSYMRIRVKRGDLWLNTKCQ